HAGVDFSGVEGITRVVAATDGVVVMRGEDILEGTDSTVKPRYDVVYVRDERGWYYRYSHLSRIDDGIRLGEQVSKGQVIGLLGKEGGSGGWAHLHFDIRIPMPAGRYGVTCAYAFLWQAYHEQFHPTVIAHA